MVRLLLFMLGETALNSLTTVNTVGQCGLTYSLTSLQLRNQRRPTLKFLRCIWLEPLVDLTRQDPGKSYLVKLNMSAELFVFQRLTSMTFILSRLTLFWTKPILFTTTNWYICVMRMELWLASTKTLPVFVRTEGKGVPEVAAVVCCMAGPPASVR
eukprot:Lithocolla_globosa_v1_NODE_5378_length_1251_cov_5.956522.p2 type:complete len:156 gc:universal NODE_5378_length_1251_cov_5.956522:916-449(-)